MKEGGGDRRGPNNSPTAAQLLFYLLTQHVEQQHVELAVDAARKVRLIPAHSRAAPQLARPSERAQTLSDAERSSMTGDESI